MSENIGRLIKQASNQLSRQFDQFAKQYDLTGTQLSVIDFLSHSENQEYTQQDIEQEFNIQRSTTTVLLQRMEKKELITRQVSPKDARQRLVRLTPKAQNLVHECQAYILQEQERLTQNFSTAEISIFEKILHYYIES